MLDREIGLTGPEPKKAAHIPAAGKARVECQRTVDQPDHGADILAASQHESGVREDARIVLRYLERLASEIAGLAAGCLRFFGPPLSDQPHVALRRPGQRRPIMPINRYCLLEQS